MVGTLHNNNLTAVCTPFHEILYGSFTAQFICQNSAWHLFPNNFYTVDLAECRVGKIRQGRNTTLLRCWDSSKSREIGKKRGSKDRQINKFISIQLRQIYISKDWTWRSNKFIMNNQIMWSWIGQLQNSLLNAGQFELNFMFWNW